VKSQSVFDIGVRLYEKENYSINSIYYQFITNVP